MSEDFIVKLKNGEMITINADQNDKLEKILCSAKPPAFIKINNNAVRTDYIAYVKKEAW